MTLNQIKKRLDTINKILNVLQSLAYTFIFNLLISMIFYSFGYKSFYLILSAVIFFSLPLVLWILIVIVPYSMRLEHLEEKAMLDE